MKFIWILRLEGEYNYERGSRSASNKTKSHGGKWPCMAFVVLFKAFKAVIQLPFPLREAQNPAQDAPFYGMNRHQFVGKKKESNPCNAMKQGTPWCRHMLLLIFICGRTCVRQHKVRESQRWVITARPQVSGLCLLKQHPELPTILGW